MRAESWLWSFLFTPGFNRVTGVKVDSSNRFNGFSYSYKVQRETVETVMS